MNIHEFNNHLRGSKVSGLRGLVEKMPDELRQGVGRTWDPWNG